MKSCNQFSISCHKKGVLYIATVADNVATMIYNHDNAEDTIAAIAIISELAMKSGIKQMKAFVDCFVEKERCLEQYVKSKNGQQIWTDGRFICYEWEICEE